MRGERLEYTQALATWVGNVADAMQDLVAGRLPETPGDFWFVSGDGRHARRKQRR